MLIIPQHWPTKAQHWPLSLDLMLPQHQPNQDYCFLEYVMRVKPRQLHQMADSTNPSFMQISWNLVDFMWNRKTHLQGIVTLWLCTYWSFKRKTYTWSSPKSSKWNAVLFIWKALRFSWKVALFMKSGTFREKRCTFHMKSTWNH